METDWLRSPLVCDGRVVRPGLSPGEITDRELPDICLRMHMIQDTIESSRCEGRLLNLEIFEAIDSLEDKLSRGEQIRLIDWIDTIDKFASYYRLKRSPGILVSRNSVDDLMYLAQRFNISLEGF